MASKIILDANLLLDLTLRRSDDFKDLNKIYQEIADNTFKGFITTSIIHPFGYWLTKAIKARSFCFKR